MLERARVDHDRRSAPGRQDFAPPGKRARCKREDRGRGSQEITVRLSKYVVKPVVNVMVKQVNSLKISVLGEVRRPDVYRIKTRITVFDAIAMAGGFTDLARPNRVIVLRNTPAGPQRIKINVKELVAAEGGLPFYLQTLDTVYVE